MGIKCGIVGLPNVGKSTLFNALTQAGIAAANFPFCTIEPNTGVVPVPDPRLGQLAEIVKPQRSEEHTSELQSLMRISYAVFCLKKKQKYKRQKHIHDIITHDQSTQ